jgi:phosphoenolpyruvate-protein phosphotransferase (PTS system enzyme I)
MIPMVTVPQELSACRTLLDEVVAGLEREHVACARPPLGMMVEVPAAAIVPELFSEAAFFSIGSNDLTQYVTASARDDAGVAALNDPSHPAVLRLIGNVAAYGSKHDVPVSLCGDMAGEPRHLESLLRAGLRSISVAPSALARVKCAIAAIRIGPLP